MLMMTLLCCSGRRPEDKAKALDHRTLEANKVSCCFVLRSFVSVCALCDVVGVFGGVVLGVVGGLGLFCRSSVGKSIFCCLFLGWE